MYIYIHIFVLSELISKFKTIIIEGCFAEVKLSLTSYYDSLIRNLLDDL